jgi:hypothetical protein
MVRTATLPPVLKGCFGVEPKWVELTSYRGGADKRDARFTELATDFAAAIRGIPKGRSALAGGQHQRKALMLASSAAVALLVLTVGATVPLRRQPIAASTAYPLARSVRYMVKFRPRGAPS